MNRRKSPESLRRQQHPAGYSDDMISDLPDSILSHILSFLPTKNAVATGILSKNWKFLWTTVGNLDFLFHLRGGGSVEQFVKSVNYVMLLHKPAGYFNKLSLTWKTECIPFYVNTWICAAISKDVHELILSLDSYYYKLPIYVQSYLFTHKKLKSLDLEFSICISTDTVVLLPRLERLKLKLVSFQDEESFSRLIDGCPVLKHLDIRVDIQNMVKCGYIETVQGGVCFSCRIASESLKHVEVSGCGHKSGLCSVELDAPSLEYFKSCMDHIVVKQRPKFLCEADIYISSFEQESIVPDYCDSLVKALEGLSCAKAINLSTDIIRALSCATIKMQTGFNRLTQLTVLVDSNYWSAIQNFIELSDKLEYLLVCKYKHHDDDEGHSNWTRPSVVPRCLSNSLKTVMFTDYNGRPDELALVEYIIKHGRVLYVMIIGFGDEFSCLNRKHELIQLISTFPRKSSLSEIELSDCGKTVNVVMHRNAYQPSNMMSLFR